QSAHRTVTDGDQEILAGNRGMAQYALDRFTQADADQIQVAMHRILPLDIARHARGLAQDHVDGDIDRPRLSFRLGLQGVGDARQAFAERDAQLTVFGGDAHDGVGAALAAGDGVEPVQVLGQYRQYIAFLRFVA